MWDNVPISDIVIELGRHNLLPTIVFRSARVQCDNDAERAAQLPQLRLSPSYQLELRDRVREVASLYEMDMELITSHPQYNALVMTAIGAHHAGQLLMWRLLLEELMCSGHLRALVATGTVAAGVDFPARTVVITAHSRRGADGFRALTASELQQMSGRAGRRGKDTVGFCVVAPSRFCDARVVSQVAKQPPEPLVSAYFTGPSTVLNLLRYRTVDGLQYTVERSLATFHDREEAVLLRGEAIKTLQSLPESFLERSGGDKVQTVEQLLPYLSGLEGEGGVVSQLSKDQRKVLKRARRFAREADSLQEKQAVLLHAALEGLRQLKYVEGYHLSEKGLWAANLYTNLVLELGEIIEAGLLDEASVETLVAVIGSITGDPHRQYLQDKTRVFDKGVEEKLANILSTVGALGMPGASEPRVVNHAAARTCLTWLGCETWQTFRSILLFSGVAEGDAARVITQTAEQLNQISRLGQTHFRLAMRAEEAKRRLLRPPLTEDLPFEG